MFLEQFFNPVPIQNFTCQRPKAWEYEGKNTDTIQTAHRETKKEALIWQSNWNQKNNDGENT